MPLGNLLYCTLPSFLCEVAGVAHCITLRFHLRHHLCLLFITSWRSCDGETLMLIHDKDYFVLVLIYYTKLVKIPWHLHKLSSGNKNMGMSWADYSIKFDEICPLAVPNQISTISMHIPNLVKIHWCLLKLSSGNEIPRDRWLMDGRTHGHPMWNHNTPPLSCDGL